MSQKGGCGTEDKAGTSDGYEVVRIEKVISGCHVCDDYAERQKAKPVAVMCCEGACLRGRFTNRPRVC